MKLWLMGSKFWCERVPCWIRRWHCWTETGNGYLHCIDCGKVPE